MEADPSQPVSQITNGTPYGYISNGDVQRYMLEADSTTGFVAFRLEDGTTLVSQAEQVSLQASPSIHFWACAGYQDTTPAGSILSFDCHGNALTKLDVRALARLEYLDCSFNNLVELPLDGLTELQALDVDNNQLTTLEVRNLHELRVLNCANNRLTRLDLSGMCALQVLDCSGNPLSAPELDGCVALQDRRGKTLNSVRSESRGRSIKNRGVVGK
jgi:hypothetical protein